jgi:hypothetical protein
MALEAVLGSLTKKVGVNAVFCLTKDGTVFPLFCLINPAQDNTCK